MFNFEKELASQDIFNLIKMFYIIESHAVLKYENTTLDYFPEEEMKADFLWHNKQEKVHENGFFAFLKKYDQQVIFSEQEKKLAEFLSLGNICEKYIDVNTLNPETKYFPSIDLFAYFSYLEYQETFAYRNYLSLANILESKKKFNDLVLILKTFARDELEHARYARKWSERIGLGLTAMIEIKTKGNILRHISQLTRVSLLSEVTKLYGENNLP